MHQTQLGTPESESVVAAVTALPINHIDDEAVYVQSIIQ